MAKHAAQREKPKHRKDLFAGWGFWLVVFVTLYVPSWFWVSRNAYNDQKSGIFPWSAAFIMAALGAGIISWLVNAALRRWSSHAKIRDARAKR